MRRSVKLVVVIPVGLLSDKYPWEDLVDTLRSINCYTSPSTQIILQTNGAYDLRSQVRQFFLRLWLTIHRSIRGSLARYTCLSRKHFCLRIDILTLTCCCA